MNTRIVAFLAFLWLSTAYGLTNDDENDDILNQLLEETNALEEVPEMVSHRRFCSICRTGQQFGSSVFFFSFFSFLSVLSSAFLFVVTF